MMFPSLCPLLLAFTFTLGVHARFVMYLDEWHPTRPTNPADRAGIDHVILAFAQANNTANFVPKVPVQTIRDEFPGAKVMIAVGGWGDDVGFNEASKSDEGMRRFAEDCRIMLDRTGADGVDIDWEYPGGNSADYKSIPNSAKTYQIPAYPRLLSHTRAAIGPSKLLSIAVPGKQKDMLAFTPSTAPAIWSAVDFVNVMTYDLMNRRDTHTTHHTSIAGSADTITRYLSLGAPAEKLNLGLAFYAKYFSVPASCSGSGLGCPILPAEDPATGSDALTSGAWTFEKQHMAPLPADPSALPVSNDGTCGPEPNTRCPPGTCCSAYGNCGSSPEHCGGACQHAFGTGCVGPDIATSWARARAGSRTDEHEGGEYFLDSEQGVWWSWDTPELVARKFGEIVDRYGLGGVMAWSLGEDSADWSRVRRIAGEVGRRGGRGGRPHGPGGRPGEGHGGRPSSGMGKGKKPYNTVYVDGSPTHPERPGVPNGFEVPWPPHKGNGKRMRPQHGSWPGPPHGPPLQEGERQGRKPNWSR